MGRFLTLNRTILSHSRLHQFSKQNPNQWVKGFPPPSLICFLIKETVTNIARIANTVKGYLWGGGGYLWVEGGYLSVLGGHMGG